MKSETHPMRRFYRNITFDTLKERHDNFSFNKSIKTKNVMNDTMHFQGILDNPTDPKLVVYPRVGGVTENMGIASVALNHEDSGY